MINIGFQSYSGIFEQPRQVDFDESITGYGGFIKIYKEIKSNEH
jgi:hypothetical protein